jgi:hypothetical protein
MISAMPSFNITSVDESSPTKILIEASRYLNGYIGHGICSALLPIVKRNWTMGVAETAGLLLNDFCWKILQGLPGAS